MLIHAAQDATSAPRSPSAYAVPLSQPVKPNVAASSPTSPPTAADDGDVIVTARDNEQFRLRPITPPTTRPSFFARPLRIQLAPGVIIGGASASAGLGLQIQFGKGRKSGEKVQEPPPIAEPTPSPRSAD